VLTLSQPASGSRDRLFPGKKGEGRSPASDMGVPDNQKKKESRKGGKTPKVVVEARVTRRKKKECRPPREGKKALPLFRGRKTSDKEGKSVHCIQREKEGKVRAIGNGRARVGLLFGKKSGGGGGAGAGEGKKTDWMPGAEQGQLFFREKGGKRVRRKVL